MNNLKVPELKVYLGIKVFDIHGRRDIHIMMNLILGLKMLIVLCYVILVLVLHTLL
jgi:hypothetical protein